MKIFFATVAIAYFIATNANLSVKPTKSDQMRKAQCHMTYNTNFYAGPNCKNLKQQLAEIKEGIREMKRNETRKKTVQGLYKLFLYLKTQLKCKKLDHP